MKRLNLSEFTKLCEGRKFKNPIRFHFKIYKQTYKSHKEQSKNFDTSFLMKRFMVKE